MAFRALPHLITHLKAVEGEESCGWLTGCEFDHATTLLHLSGASRPEHRDELQRLLPNGISICGAWIKQEAKQEAITRLQQMAAASVKAVGAPFAGVIILPNGLQWHSLFAGLVSEATVDSLAEADAEKWMQKSCRMLRCSMPLHAQVFGLLPAEGCSVCPKEKAIAAAVNLLRKQLQSCTVLTQGSRRLGFQGLEEEGNGRAVCDQLGGSQPEPTEVHLLQQRYPEASSAGCTDGPAFLYQPVAGGPLSVQTVRLSLDILMLVPGNFPTASLEQQVVQPAVAAQLDAFELMLSQEEQLCDLRAFHNQPPGWPHPLTVVYPMRSESGAGKSLESMEQELLPMRKQLHQLLGLPMDRPMLRMANALTFGTADAEGGSKRLKDVHYGLPPSGVQSGTLHMVEGSYDYHHYMQDRFDDSGWGCAYRSLQTICSWMRRQQYTSASVPTHQDIQRTLVDIGDKPSTFVGSKQWIGAIELGFILDTLLGVSCKVITVSSGADIPSKAREIAHHFDTQGTPIMIGGGVLAYTLLGIDYNERTGQCAFLILDPHYTGSDDLKAIHKGQWVAWKRADGKAAAGGELFVKSAFYNLLCPQRPRTV